ncbi:MAG: hypothetical protein LQ352_006207 [Teloschistes flavicans]|nr:MAG: hypothetical protein LQ352_006207 [Teloschistes flavicans]
MDDLDDFHSCFSDDDVMRYWSTAPHTDTTQTEKYLRGMVDSQWNGICDFAIQYTAPSVAPKVIGKIGLWNGHEIGFMLDRAFWGKGLMKEAMNQFLSDLWKNEKMKDLKEIEADVDPRNDASVGILKKFGFKETGYRERTFETHLGWCDSLDLIMERPAAVIN